MHQFSVDHGTTGEGRQYGRPIFPLRSDKTGDDHGHRQPQVHLEAAPDMLDVNDPDVGVEKEMTLRRAGAERQTEYAGRQTPEQRSDTGQQCERRHQRQQQRIGYGAHEEPSETGPAGVRKLGGEHTLQDVAGEDRDKHIG